MPFVKPSLQTIIDRVETDITSRLTGSVALLRTALLKILGKVFSGAIHTCYGYLDYIAINILPDLAQGAWLDRHGLMWGVTRIKATFADGVLECTGVNGIDIPIGTVFVRDDGWEYATTSSGTITGGVATVDVEAVTAGLNGNTDVGVEFTISNPISGLDDTATVDIEISGGTDRETDEDYRERILFRIQNPPAGGAERDYIAIGNAVAGVEQTFVFGAQDVLTPEPGHVTCVILGISPKIPSAGILQDVEDALLDLDTGIVPVDIEANDGLHVEPITEADLKIYISITPDPTENPDLVVAINTSIQQLYTDVGSPGGIILLSKLRNAIATAGPDDYEITDIKVGGGSIGVTDIDLDDFDYPIDDGNVYATL